MKVIINHGANALVTPYGSAMKVATIRGATDSVMTVHRCENQILPSVKHIYHRIEHNTSSAVERAPSLLVTFPRENMFQSPLPGVQVC